VIDVHRPRSVSQSAEVGEASITLHRCDAERAHAAGLDVRQQPATVSIAICTCRRAGPAATARSPNRGHDDVDAGHLPEQRAGKVRLAPRRRWNSSACRDWPSRRPTNSATDFTGRLGVTTSTLTAVTAVAIGVSPVRIVGQFRHQVLGW